MGSLSQSIACMSCRLYFSTGVWPVWREWDFAPAQTETQAEATKFGCLLLRTRIAGHIQAGNAYCAGCPRDLHQAVEHDSGRFDDPAVCTLRLGLEADAVDCAVDLWNAEDIGDEFAKTIVPGEIDRLEADFLGVSEPLLVPFSDPHGCRAEDARRCCSRKADWPCPGDVDGRSDPDLGGDGPVESRRQNIGAGGPMTDLFHPL